MNEPVGYDARVTVSGRELEQTFSSWAKKCATQEKEIARLHKIIEKMYALGNGGEKHYSVNRIYDMFVHGVNENGMVCDCCECAPCICVEGE